MQINIDELLRQAVALSASDVHLKVGSSPVARVNGEIRRLDGYASLTPEDTQNAAEAIFTPRAAEEFKLHGHVDFAYGRQDLGRFRASAFRQRGSVSLVMRRVVSASRGFSELGLPRIVEKLAAEQSGLLLVDRTLGLGQDLDHVVDRRLGQRQPRGLDPHHRGPDRGASHRQAKRCRAA